MKLVKHHSFICQPTPVKGMEGYWAENSRTNSIDAQVGSSRG